MFWYFTVFYHPVLLCILLTTLSYLFTFHSLALPICQLVNTNGIPHVCAAFCDSVSLCDGPDDDHLMGRNMLSIWHFYGNERILLCWRIIFYVSNKKVLYVKSTLVCCGYCSTSSFFLLLWWSLMMMTTMAVIWW